MIRFSDEELQKLVDIMRKKDALATLLANYDHTKGELPNVLIQTLKKNITDEPVEKFIADKKPSSDKDIKALKLEYFKALRDQRVGNGEKKANEDVQSSVEGDSKDVSSE